MELVCRNIVEEDIVRVNDFYNNYHKAGRDENRFRWEFQNGPHGKGIYTLAEDRFTGQILGIQAGIPLILRQADGTEILSAKSEDSLIDVDACSRLKRKDVFSVLYQFFIRQCSDRGIQVIWGFTWAINSLKRQGFEIPFSATTGIMVFKPAQASIYLSSLNPNNKLRDRIKIRGLAFYSKLANLLLPLRPNADGFQINRLLVTNTELVAHLDRTSSPLFLKQDAGYLKWRLQDNPYPIKYHVVNFIREKVLTSQVIFSINGDGIAYIEQVLFNQELTFKERKQVINHVIRLIRKEGSIILRFMGFDNNHYGRSVNKILKETGFIFLKRGMGFIYLPVGNSSLPGFAERIILSRLYSQGHN